MFPVVDGSDLDLITTVDDIFGQSATGPSFDVDGVVALLLKGLVGHMIVDGGDMFPSAQLDVTRADGPGGLRVHLVLQCSSSSQK